MAEYKCKCSEETVEKSGVTIRWKEEHGAYHDIKCECGEFMELTNPKSGAPGLKMNKFGSSY